MSIFYEVNLFYYEIKKIKKFILFRCDGIMDARLFYSKNYDLDKSYKATVLDIRQQIT
jgi:hypothetical protein